MVEMLQKETLECFFILRTTLIVPVDILKQFFLQERQILLDAVHYSYVLRHYFFRDILEFCTVKLSRPGLRRL